MRLDARLTAELQRGFLARTQWGEAATAASLIQPSGVYKYAYTRGSESREQLPLAPPPQKKQHQQHREIVEQSTSQRVE